MKTHDEAVEIFDNLNELPKHAVMKCARAKLNREYAGTGHGIGSSDAYHEAVYMVRVNFYDEEDSGNNSFTQSLVEQNMGGDLAGWQEMFASDIQIES